MKLSPFKAVFALLVLSTLVSSGCAILYYRRYQALKANPQMLVETENRKLIADVGKLMVLPDEQPTIATVTDPAKLKDQAFFANAKTGDKVLLFANAKKAVLYDPAAGRIVEVAPFNGGEVQAVQPETVLPTVGTIEDVPATTSKTKKP